ncbi:proton-coupled amino acid transporter-like protein pathetic isoform X2 [Anabrus simplex]|uniref:proton-coupled amino acid transporter-like protein pathetic isoform X2 n=1 Tax=Anabrus simplex TaxID=316456 RepID=UPI0035A36260
MSLQASGIKTLGRQYGDEKGDIKTQLPDQNIHKTSGDKTETALPFSNGSTTILFRKADKNEEAYDPFAHREVSHPTTDLDTLVHLLKGCLGSGILAMPLAFYNAGLLFGIIATMLIVVICTHCVHILVKCAHILCQRIKVPSLGFSDVAEAAFSAGPPTVRKWSGFAGGCINLFLAVDLLGCCCVYVVFITKNIQQVVEYYTEIGWPIQYYMVIVAPFLVTLNMVPNLKYLAPFSMLANTLMAVGLGITFYYIFSDLPSITNSGLPNFSSWSQLPLFFGTVIFALEGIGVVMPLENNMKNPDHFIGCPGVLNFGMGTVGVLYTAVGFFGYVKYGERTEASITLNLPTNEMLAQSVKIMIALAIFFTYGLQFYVPREIIWNSLKQHFPSHKTTAEYSIRILLVLGTVGLSAGVPNLGSVISLVGAVTLSTLGLIFPSVIELVTYWEHSGLGKFKWRLWKNTFVILFGILGFATGAYSSILEIVHGEKN